MALIKPYANKWYHIPRAKDPDQDFLSFAHNSGEFSVNSDIAFQKHLQKLLSLNQFFNKYHLNFKTKIKQIIQNEKLWYAGLYVR